PVCTGTGGTYRYVRRPRPPVVAVCGSPVAAEKDRGDVPYPVPFRLLGDEAKGWLDTTYLSHTGNIRISRGNKKIEPRQRLLSAVSVGTRVKEVWDMNIHSDAHESIVAWSENESWSSVVASGVRGLQIIKKDGMVENQISLLPGLRICANGNLR
ncbi:hypothetical protein GW17_00038958, partial [Ensete ventricosum]